MARMVLRVLLAVAGVAVVIWAGVRDGDVRSCEAAGLSTFKVRTDAEADRAAGRVEAACRGAALPASASSVLIRRGADDAARRLARVAVAREPENAAAWVAAGTVARRDGDEAALAEARARLRRLDPASRALG